MRVDGLVTFSGPLYLSLSPESIQEKESILLFEFDKSIGKFDELYIVSGTCEIIGELTYSQTSLIMQVDEILCSTTTDASASFLWK